MFKKIFTAFICTVLSALLVSCQSAPHVRRLNISGPLNFHAYVKFDGKEYEADISLISEDEVKIAFTAPKSMKNTVLEMHGDKCYLRVYGIQVPINDGGYALDNGLLLTRYLLNVSQNSYANAEIVHLSGIKYCVENYDTREGRISAYFIEGRSFPERIKARLNGHDIELIIVN